MRFLDIAILISFSFLLLAMLLTIFRLVKGPEIYDRIATMDLIASIVVGFVLLYGLLINNNLYVDVAIVLALISFIGTIAISTNLDEKNN